MVIYHPLIIMIKIVNMVICQPHHYNILFPNRSGYYNQRLGKIYSQVYLRMYDIIDQILNFCQDFTVLKSDIQLFNFSKEDHKLGSEQSLCGVTLC